MEATGSDNRDLLAELASAHSRVCSAQLRLLEVVAFCDDPEVWSKDGARDLAEWLSARLGISNWAARRWIAAAHALEHLPRLRGALGSGALSQDKVVELCRFATPETEGGLISWARGVGVAAVRRRADLCVLPNRIWRRTERVICATGGSTTAGAWGWRRHLRPPTGRS